VGRDRDPFDKTLETLRRRLAEQGPLQGAPLSVKAIAAELGFSPTPVREALSRLAGEGLVARTPAGYAGLVHTPKSLADLYDLAAILGVAVLRAASAIALPDAQGAGLVALAAGCANRALADAFARVLAQLAPFARAELAQIGRAHV
jgi:DNA-binding GntR family transcriptional regulator